MQLQDVHNAYFIGIGGIGMSALARYFRHMGKNVSGYDRTATPITDELTVMGVSIHFEAEVDLIPKPCKESKHTLVVYTPAISEEHQELRYFRQNGFVIKKRSEVLGIVTKDTFCLAVAGTHGKTTTSCILAHLLKGAGAAFIAFLGGISEDFRSNFIFRGSEYAVVEADEYDRSFLQLYPDVACITSMDADHLDIYQTDEQLKKSFFDFTHNIKTGGKLIIRNGLEMNGITFGIEDASDFCITNIKIEHGTYIFDLKTPETTHFSVRFNKPGRHNLLNGLAAFAMAVSAGFPPHRLVEALATFKGVQRRFSYQVKEKNLVFIDDYAHHPTEIDAVYDAIIEMHPGLKITAVFQPHLYSRTRDFVEEFAVSLAKFDMVLLLDIYPAREKPIPGVTSTWLLQRIANPNKRLVDKSNLIDEIRHSDPEVLVTMGAGDIGLEVSKIKKELAYAS
ncbi:MAG: UDP-N-acetylmuramate--L-alanine ligase [Bacteroidota bacterium]